MSDENYYGIKRWGDEYFDVNASGQVIVKPFRKDPGGNLFDLVKSLVAQDIEAPVLIRFNGIIQDRIQTLHSAFQSAIRDFNYRNTHRMMFPIKVNPQRHVVETVQHAGRELQMGLEVGSKPELIAVLTLPNQSEAMLLCNGYKDAEYISLALTASKLGKNTLIIIEQPYELKLTLEIAKQLGVEAQIGFRMKLSSIGSGRWKSSGGEHSKFGLFSHEIIACIEMLKTENKLHWAKLLHFHLGSQITTIESIKKALKEAARTYTELANLLPNFSYIDVGGGLAVDYDGTKSESDSSMNYTLDEYARDVVYAIGEACLAAGVADPTIITEAGRAIAAHHSVLIIEVIDVTSPSHPIGYDKNENQHEILRTLNELDEELSLKNCRETFHDVIELKDRVLEEFIYGKLNLRERATAEKMCRALLGKIRTFYKQLRQVPEDIELLDKILIETYFCNFSVFQSLPDSWGIGQLFPIMPIHRLNEAATHQGIIADLTCDSDGKISSFIGDPEPANFLKLHEYTGEPYYLGIFLVGAYQEILGDLHNLFGDTNVVHAELGLDGSWELSHLVEGDTNEEVLNYVQYNTEKLLTQLHELIEHSIKAGRITLTESAQIKKKLKQALESYTYLVQ